MVATKLLTIEEFEAMPDDGHRYELVRGELVRMPPPGLEHLRVIGLVSHYLNLFVIPLELGIVGSEGGFTTERGPDTLRMPDVAFIRADRFPTGADAFRAARFAPDIAVEVRSPSDTMRDLRAKADEYLVAGTQLAWIFDPNSRTVVVKTSDGQERRLGIGDTLDGGDVLPGFELPLSAIFRGE